MFYRCDRIVKSSFGLQYNTISDNWHDSRRLDLSSQNERITCYQFVGVRLVDRYMVTYQLRLVILSLMRSQVWLFLALMVLPILMIASHSTCDILESMVPGNACHYECLISDSTLSFYWFTCFRVLLRYKHAMQIGTSMS